MTDQSGTYLPKHISKDGAKWLFIPTKIALDGVSLWPERQNNLTLLLNILCVCSSVFILVGNCFYIRQKDVDLVSAAFALSMLILNIETPARVILSRFYRKELEKLLQKVYLEFWPSNMAGNALHEQISKISRYLLIYIVGYTFAALIYLMLYITMEYYNGRTPFRTAYPFPWQESPYYEIIYIWQSFYLIGMLIIITGMDLLFISLLFNCLFQFKMFRIYLKENFQRIVQNKCSKSEARGIMLLCIKRHINLISVCNEIDRVFSYFMLTQYLINVGSICLSSFIASILPGMLATAFTYLSGHMSEMFIYCYLGNELILESTELSNAIFECGWHLFDMDKDLKKSLIIVMIRSQKPLRISTGGFGALSLSSFMGLIRFSFSVYTLLNSLMNKQNI